MIRFLSGLLVFVIAHAVPAISQQMREGSQTSFNSRLATQARSLEFIPNRGQDADQYHRPMPEVLYTAKARGVQLNITKDGMRFIFARVIHDSTNDSAQSLQLLPPQRFFESHKNDSIEYFRLDLEFEGANPNPMIEAVDLAEDYTNYYLPQCPNGILHVPAYHKLIYHDLYPHIDLVLYSPKKVNDTDAPDSMEYDFVVHPGGNPSRIQLHYTNPDSLRLEAGGNAIISTLLGSLIERAPNSYLAETEQAVASAFSVEGSTLRFVTAPYDSSRSLIIDPPRLWGTYYGGPTNESIYEVTVDKDDNVIAIGNAQSSSGISSPGAYQLSLSGTQDAFIVKLSPAGAWLWATYFGGSSSEYGFAVVTDQSGNIYVGGQTSSTNGITTAGAHQTTPGMAFLEKFDSSGVRLWGTYFGGPTSGGTTINGLACDSNSNIYATGSTQSTSGIATSGTFKTTNPAGYTNAFVTSFTSSGTQKWGTYFGGPGGTLTTNGFKIAIDLDDDILICGQTTDTIGIATRGTFDTLFQGGGTSHAGFVAQFDTLGQRTWGTYFADTAKLNNQFYNGISSLACSRKGGIIVGGWTTANWFATSGAYQSSISGSSVWSPCLMKFDSLGRRIWGTYINGFFPLGIALDKSYDVIFGGSAMGGGLASSGEYQTTYGGGGSDAFIAKFTTSGTFRWGTYYGGSGSDIVRGFVLDREGHPIIAGQTNSTNAIASAGAYQSVYPTGSTGTGFIAKFCDTVHAPLFFSSASNAVCYGECDTLTAGAGFLNYQWKQNGAVISGATTNKYVLPVLAPGTYIYTVQVVDPDACASNTDTLPIVVRALPVDSFANNVSICSGSSIRIGDTAKGAGPPFIYSWTPSTGLDHPDSARAIASPIATTKYYLFVTDTNGCQLEDSVTVTVNPVPQLHAGGNQTICYGDSVRIGGTATLGTPPYTYQWSPSVGLSSTSQPVVNASPKDTTKYFELVTDANGCEVRDSVEIFVNARPHPPLLQAQHVCLGTTVVIGGTATGGHGPYQYSWSPGTGLSNSHIATPVASPSTTTKYTLTITDADGCDTNTPQNVTVFIPPTPVITTDSTVVYCTTDSAHLDAGIGYVSYLWSNGATGQVIHAPAGTYTVTVTDTNGCSGTSQPVTITQIAPPPAVVSGPSSECPNAVASYYSQDKRISSYAWSLSGGGTIVSGSSQDTVKVRWILPGLWQLALKETMNAGGCELDTTITITVADSLRPTIALNRPTTICSGDTIVLTAETGYDSYAWSSGDTTRAISVSSSGDYRVHVVNGAGCAGSNDVKITVLPDSVPRPVLTTASTSICRGDSIEIKTTQNYAGYQWSTGATTPSIFVSKAGSYSVVASNAVGCTGASSPLFFKVVPRPKVQLVASGPTTFCSGDSVTLLVTHGYRYVWFNNSTRLSDTAASLFAKTSGSYWASAIDSLGCDSLAGPIDVVVKPRPHITIAGPSSVCINGMSGYRVSSSASSTILWSITPPSLGSIVQGQGTDSVTVQWGPQAAGTLQVTVSENGCDTTALLSVMIDTSLSPTITADGPTAFCIGDTIILDAGAGYATYRWSKDAQAIAGATSELLTVSQAGDYAVYVTNSSGCNGTSQVTRIIVHPLPSKPLISRVGTQLTSSIANRYSWTYNGASLLASTQSIVAKQDGSYIVTIADSNGCNSMSDPYVYSNTGTATVSLATGVVANPGDAVTIPLTLIDSKNLLEAGATTYTAQVHFNSSLLAPQGLSSLGTVSNGERTITVSGPVSKPTGVLQDLNFIATLGDDSCTDLVLDTFYFPDANVNVTRENGGFCLTGICVQDGHARLINPDASISLSEPRPNPASQSISIDYHLAEPGLTKLFFEDLLGRTVLVIRNEAMMPGAYRENVSIAPLTSGTYRYVLLTPSQVLSRRMEVVK